jgi:acetyltransferase-like isoleucine patch superfamily enzyme
METTDIFERERSGQIISIDDPEYWKIADLIAEAQQVIAEMNTGYRTPQEVRDFFSRLTGVPVHPSFWMLPPFYTDFGRNIRVGEDVFINHGCEFMDRGGITLEDKVLIGPKVNLITINHPVEPSQRRSTFCAPILIKRNAWIGVGASVMPGVTIGENSIVAANAVVTSRCSGQYDRWRHTCESGQDLRRRLGFLGRFIPACYKMESPSRPSP